MPNKLEQAQEALAKVEAHMETLTPQTQARHMAERVRDNLAACIAMAQCNPKAGEILMPNVLTAAHEYLSGLGRSPGYADVGRSGLVSFLEERRASPRPLILPHPLRVV